MRWKQIGGLGAIAAGVLAALLSNNGKPPAKPPVTTVPASDVRAAITVLADAASRTPVPGLLCGLQLDRLPSDTDVPPSLACDYSGVQAFFTVAGPLAGRGGWLTLSADTFESATMRVIVRQDGWIHNDADQPFEWQMQPDVKPLPQLRARGQYIEQTDWQRWTYIGATDFNLLARFSRGEDITPILQQRSGAGFNVLRVLTAFNVCPDGFWPDGRSCQPMGRLFPSENYYGKVEPFLRLLAKYKMYAELVAFAGKWSQSASDDDMVRHFVDLHVAVCNQPFPVFVELANEYDHPANAGVPYNKLAMFDNMPLQRQRPVCQHVMFSNASAVQDSTPRLPVKDYATYRPGSGPEWMRKVAHNGMEDVADKLNVPTVANETTRFPDNDSNPEHAFDAAAGAALLSAGSTFHSVHGKNSTLWEGVELDAAKAWARGARSVPLACQGLPYFRIDDFSFLRTYRRGNDAACMVRIRK